MRFLLVILTGLYAVGHVSAQFGDLTYNFFGPAGTQNISSVSAISSPTNVSITGVTAEPIVNMINAKQWSNQSTVDVGKYFSFNFTTAQAISIPSVTVAALSTTVGPTTMEIRSSIDTFSTSIGSISLTPNTTNNITFNLPESFFGNIASGTNVEFRLYGYNASNNGTNSQLGLISGSATTPGLIVPIATPVPEPLSVLAISVLGFGAIRTIRRTKQK